MLFPVFPILNEITLKIFVHMFLSIFKIISLGQIPRKGITGSKDLDVLCLS